MTEEKGLRKPLRKWRKGERLQEGGGAGRHRVLLLFSPSGDDPPPQGHYPKGGCVTSCWEQLRHYLTDANQARSGGGVGGS